MQSNNSEFPSVFYMEPLVTLPAGIYAASAFGILTFCLVLIFNLTLILTIVLNEQLHTPMYLLLLNLPLNDMMGATAFYPQLITSILSQDRSISYSACFLQGVLVHLYAAGALLILTAMAYDRYIAICCPLRYNSIMSTRRLTSIISVVWLTDIALVGLLFILLARFKSCRSLIPDMYCNNPSLLKLVCEDTSLNNYYGLFITFFIQSVSLFAIIFTYTQILYTCLINKQSDTKSKAIRTCGTHLAVFLLFELTTLIMVLSHRFNEVSPHLRRSVGISFLVFPPILNPMIYGLNTQEIRKKVINFIHRQVYPN